jgi:hypothetical protein
MVDAVAVRRSARSGLDWGLLVWEASRRRLTLSLAASLEHLSQDVEFPVPEWVLQRLRAVPKSRLERRVYRASMRPVGRGRWLLVELNRFRRCARLDSSLGYGDFPEGSLRGRHAERADRPARAQGGSVALFQARRLRAARPPRVSAADTLRASGQSSWHLPRSLPRP